MKKTIIKLFIIAAFILGSSAYNYTSGQTTEEKQKEIKKETTVYVTNTGSKYHKAGCYYLKQSSNEIELSKAKEKSYTPCSRCYYDSKEFAPLRCTATTKAGTQCKRKASAGSSRCWQH